MAKSVQEIKAKMIAEGANGPVTASGEDVLLSRGIAMLPDIYTNAGGVTVSWKVVSTKAKVEKVLITPPNILSVNGS